MKNIFKVAQKEVNKKFIDCNRALRARIKMAWMSGYFYHKWKREPLEILPGIFDDGSRCSPAKTQRSEEK